MGKREEEDGKKVLTHQTIKVKTRFSLIDLLLWPIRAFQQKRREAQIRKNLLNTPAPQIPDHVKNDWIYKTITEEELPKDAQIVKKDDWLYGIVTDDDTENKGE